ncbi:hypothetical protein PAPHI01_1764 [Pancytospora philotis]|nr:hypothetical protein PAPHI01_1764 [Pancytospora philotis]
MPKNLHGQTTLNFGQPAVQYCAHCSLRYNSCNPEDVRFHARMHRKIRLPRRMQIAPHFYQARNKIVYGRRHIEAWCTLKKVDATVVIANCWSASKDTLRILRTFIETHFTVLSATISKLSG